MPASLPPTLAAAYQRLKDGDTIFNHDGDDGHWSKWASDGKAVSARIVDGLLHRDLLSVHGDPCAVDCIYRAA